LKKQSGHGTSTFNGSSVIIYYQATTRRTLEKQCNYST
jgi:hypothetical protein